MEPPSRVGLPFLSVHTLAPFQNVAANSTVDFVTKSETKLPKGNFGSCDLKKYGPGLPNAFEFLRLPRASDRIFETHDALCQYCWLGLVPWFWLRNKQCSGIASSEGSEVKTTD